MFCRFDFYDGICILFLCVSSIVSDDDGKAEAVFNGDDGKTEAVFNCDDGKAEAVGTIVIT